MIEEDELDSRMTLESRNIVRALLQTMKPSDAINLDINQQRLFREVNATRVNQGLSFPNLSITEFNVTNLSDNFQVPVTCYKPKNYKEHSPITVFFHGGGWTLNSRITHHHTVASLADASSSIWLSVEYRLSPEVQYPVNLNDCLYVVKWVVANRDQISSKKAKIGVSGDSSGGHFAALITHQMSNEIDFQILVYPVVHLGVVPEYKSHYEFTRDCYLLVPSVMNWFISNLMGTNCDELKNTPELSPVLLNDFSKIPRTLILAAELDPLVDHSRDYFKKLQTSGVKADLFVISGVHHGFFSQPVLMKNAFEEVKQKIVEFFEDL